MNYSIEALVHSLENPGLGLAFCDETDLTHARTQTMMPDIHLVGAIVLPSSSYVAVRSEMERLREGLSLPPFHATEIVNPNKRSSWSKVDLPTRLDAYQRVCRILGRTEIEVHYVHIAKTQYGEMRERLGGTAMPKDFKSGARKVFEASIQELVRPGPSCIVMDRTGQSASVTLTKLKGAEQLRGEGIFRAPSSKVSGLQLADVALYVVGRHIRRRDSVKTGDSNAFDEITMETVAGMEGRFHSLLTSEPENE